MELGDQVLEERGSYGPAATGLSEAEKRLLSAATTGDVATVNDMLIYGRRTLDVNCRDALGRSAVELAVDGGRLDVAEVLLHYGAKPGEALMYAVDKGDVAAVEKLLKFPTKMEHSPSVAFPPDMTPILLACHKNNLPIIKCLVNHGMLIREPDVSTSNYASTDELLNLYRGLASPYYILLTNKDPLQRVFQLSTKLDDLEAETPEQDEGFSRMAEDCRSLGEELLGQVRNSDEAAAILNCGDDISSFVHGDSAGMKLSLLDMAVDHNQKKFVTDRWSQRLVKESWYGSRFKPKTSLQEYIRSFTLMLLYPILVLTYLIAPTSKAGNFIKTPAVRFALYLASFATFLVLVLLRAEKVGFDGPIYGDLAPNPTIVEWLIFFWIMGMLLEETRLIWKLGFRNCLADSITVNAWLIIILYLATAILRVAAHIYHGGSKDVYRFRWKPYDATLIAEALASVGSVVAFLRLISLLTLDQFLGPMTLSMIHMIKDVVKFLIIFFIIVIAFSSGLNELYGFYSNAVLRLCENQGGNATSPLTYTTCSTENAFGDFRRSFTELFWTLFGLGSKDTLNLSINPESNKLQLFNEHTLTMYVGYSLYGLYLVVAVVVLLNMLIAMMSNSYQAIVDNETTEWRFEVTRIMLIYIRDEPTLPAPFNLIPNPKFIYNIIKRFCLKGRYRSEMDCKQRAKEENERRYKEVLSRLVRRYLLTREREKGVEPIFADVITPQDAVTNSAWMEDNGASGVATAEPQERTTDDYSTATVGGVVNAGAMGIDEETVL